MQREKRQVKTEAEIRTMQLQANEHEDLLGAIRIRKRRERNSSLEPSQRMWPCRYLHFSLLTSRATGEEISVEFSHPVCGNLLQQP